MENLPIYNLDGKKVDDLDIPENLFGVEVNRDVLHQDVLRYLANQRQGNASTKERGAVSGGGVKPWRQKGTGRARVGSSRNPLWKGGGVVFGPHPHSFRFEVPQKVRKVALKESLNDKYQSKNLLCIDHLRATSAKTKDFAKILERLKLDGKILALLDGNDPQTLKVSRNIPHFRLLRAEDVTAYEILRSQKLLVTKGAFKILLKRLK